MHPNFPDLMKQGITCQKELQVNHLGGRNTYLGYYNSNPDTKIVIKLFTFAKGSKWSEFNQIEREIKNLKKLNHPKIPKYLDSFNTEHGLCVITKYISGQNLGEISENISPMLAYDIVLQILEILIFLQSKDKPIIHQDIKPQNIILGKDNQAFLIDFGLAREDSNNSLSINSAIGGTRGFLSPEQFYRSKVNITVYALAVTYFCLLVRINNKELSEQINVETNKIPFRTKLQNITNSDIVAWLEKCTQPNFKNRFQNAKQARTALQNINPKKIKISKPIDTSEKQEASTIVFDKSKKPYWTDEKIGNLFFMIVMLLSPFIMIPTLLHVMTDIHEELPFEDWKDQVEHNQY